MVTESPAGGHVPGGGSSSALVGAGSEREVGAVPPAGFQTLTSRCGHHCGVTTSSDIRTVGHCSCSDCHGEPMGQIVSTRVAAS